MRNILIKLFISIFLIFCTNLICLSVRTLDVTTGQILNGDRSSEPIRNVQGIEDGVIVTYEFQNALIINDDLYADSNRILIPGFMPNDVSGQPAYLHRFDSFIIPAGYNAEVEILPESSSLSEFYLKLSPARPPLLNGNEEVYSTDNVPEISPYLNNIPISSVEMKGVNFYRGNKILNVEVSPFLYDEANSIIKFRKKIIYKVSFLHDTSGNSPINSLQQITTHDDLLRNTTLNGASLSDTLITDMNYHNILQTDTTLNRTDYLGFAEKYLFC